MPRDGSSNIEASESHCKLVAAKLAAASEWRNQSPDHTPTPSDLIFCGDGHPSWYYRLAAEAWRDRFASPEFAAEKYPTAKEARRRKAADKARKAKDCTVYRYIGVAPFFGSELRATVSFHPRDKQGEPEARARRWLERVYDCRLRDGYIEDLESGARRRDEFFADRDPAYIPGPYWSPAPLPVAPLQLRPAEAPEPAAAVPPAAPAEAVQVDRPARRRRARPAAPAKVIAPPPAAPARVVIRIAAPVCMQRSRAWRECAMA